MLPSSAEKINLDVPFNQKWLKTTKTFDLGDGKTQGFALRTQTLVFLEQITGKDVVPFLAQLDEEIKQNDAYRTQTGLELTFALIETWHWLGLMRAGIEDQDTEPHLRAQEERKQAIMALSVPKARCLTDYAIAFFGYQMKECETLTDWLGVKKKTLLRRLAFGIR